jgi:REP element-mobilizing transposase RayT
MPFWRLYYHVVWSTRDRQPLITEDIEDVVHHAIRQAAYRHGVTVHAIGGTDDHVHLVAEAPPTVTLSESIGRIKGSSSHAINQRLGGGSSLCSTGRQSTESSASPIASSVRSVDTSKHSANGMTAERCDRRLKRVRTPALSQQTAMSDRHTVNSNPTP